MTVIRINIADSLLSESAVKKSSYHIVQSSNGPMIVINSKYKPVVAKAATSLKQAKVLGVAAAKLGQTTAKLKLKLKSTRDSEKKAPISAKIKANNAKIKKDVTAAKKLATSAVASLAKAGLKVLSTPIRPSYITMTQPDYTISKIGKAKADTFWVKASGTNRSPSLLKPRFATGDKFDKIGASSAAKKPTPGAKPSDKPKPVAAKRNKGIVAGAYSPAKAKEAKAKRAAALAGVDYSEMSPAARERAITRLDKQVTKYDNIIRDGATGKRLEAATQKMKMAERERDDAIRAR
ncbi:hypothetical protein pEaSNUABM35_00191 [Erwinia phage pEa_SNUABM_35]|uniref:Uncharacterized protein n=1 Tax=Erwinia phage pEa_SNUABM_35 TaxID=2869557 RepID=A0AAE7XR52_9CAUD|nr:hypothetical protein MPK65_gp191 [Erwinia phage pEa_SNUABM_35]QZE60108.1 hypothetical protein pEaSNUABM35_00191 [Erwinia phage pEa_SNUABM_35]QZE60444.1 hypothetical protein pEaSNUABM36_00191 [Erwinia phage pEa_SNUABM_36]